MTRILSLIAFGLSIGLLISVQSLSSKVGELHSYMMNNRNVWKAQTEVNEAVQHVLEALTNNVDG